MGISRRQLIGHSVGIGAVSAALAGCGLGGVAGGGAPKPARQPVTLQYWTRFGAGHTNRPYRLTAEWEDQRLPVFAQQSAPYRVEPTVIVDHAQLLEKLTVGFVSGTGPDVFNVGSPGIPQFAHRGYVLQLDNIPAVKKEAADFFESGLKIGSYKGKLYALTYYADIRILLYRKDFLAEAGLPADRRSLPKTWDQFRDLTRKLVRWDGSTVARAGFDVPKNDEYLFLTMVAQQGKDALTPDLSKPAFDGAEGERALQTIVDLVNRDRIDSFQRAPIPSGVAPIASGVVSSVWRNTQEIGNTQAAGLDPANVLVAEFTPGFATTTVASGYLGGTWVLANAAAKDRDATLELLLFLAGYDHLLGVAERFTAVPPRKSAEKWPPLQNPLLRTFFEAQDKAWSYSPHPAFERINVEIRKFQGQALRQEIGIKEALAQMARAASAVLAGG